MGGRWRARTRARQVPPRAVRRGPPRGPGRRRARGRGRRRAAPPARRCPPGAARRSSRPPPACSPSAPTQLIETYVAETGLHPRRRDRRAAPGGGDAAAVRRRGAAADRRDRARRGAPGSEGRLAFTLRVPVGVVCAIAPFNAPLNTVAHKVAPALAAGQRRRAQARRGDAAVLGRAVLGAARRGPAARVAAARGRPGRRRSARSSSPTAASATSRSPARRPSGSRSSRARGSPRPTWSWDPTAPRSCAPTPTSTACADLVVRAGYRKAGQVCTSVQRVLVEAGAAEALAARWPSASARSSPGDPRAEGTDVGPLISVAEAERAERWVAEARTGGARLLAGGERDASLLHAGAARGAPLDSRRDARGDLRAGRRAALRAGPRRGDPDRQRLALRPPGRRVHARPRGRLLTPPGACRSAA